MTLPADHTVLYDCDGTLVDSEIIAMGVAIDILADAVLDVKPDLKIDRPALVQEYAGWHFVKMIDDMSGRYGVKLDSESLDAHKIPATLDALKKVVPIPGILEALARQRENNVPVALVTSSEFSRVNLCLDVTGVGAYFPTERKFSAHDTLSPPKHKPAPDIYLHAMKTLNADPAQCVAVEDSRSGVKSAKAAGIENIVGIVSATHIPASGKDAAARDLFANGAAIVISHADDLDNAIAWLKNPDEAPAFKNKVYLPTSAQAKPQAAPAPSL